MKSKLFLAVAVFFFTNGFAQDSSSVKTPTGKPYTLHAYKTDGAVLKGYLYEASTSGISMTHATKDPSAFTTLTPEQIDKLFLWRKGNIGKGAVFGAIGGGIIGAIFGFMKASENPYYPIATSTIAGLFLGTGVGMIIGSLTKKKFTIHGKKENYHLKYPAIVERAMIQR